MEGSAMSSNDTKALEAIEHEIGATVRGQESIDLGKMCQKYQTIKPMLLIALNLVDNIPAYGLKIASGIRFLMGMADMACPTKT